MIIFFVTIKHIEFLKLKKILFNAFVFSFYRKKKIILIKRIRTILLFYYYILHDNYFKTRYSEHKFKKLKYKRITHANSKHNYFLFFNSFFFRLYLTTIKQYMKLKL